MKRTLKIISFKFILLAYLILFFSFPLQSKEKIIVGASQRYTENPIAAGMKIYEKIAEKLGMEIEIKYRPFVRILSEMKEGKIDLMLGLLKSSVREKYIYYLNPPYRRGSERAFFVLKENKNLIKEYKDLKKLLIGVKIGINYFPVFDQDKNLKKRKLNSVDQGFKMLLHKRLDTVITSTFYGENILRDMKLSDKIVPAKYRYSPSNFIYIGVSKKSKLISKIPELEAIVKKLITSGKMEYLVKEHNSYKK